MLSFSQMEAPHPSAPFLWEAMSFYEVQILSSGEEQLKLSTASVEMNICIKSVQIITLKK